MTDKKTAYLSLPLPNADNALAEDCPRLTEALTTLDGHAQSADARLDGVEASVTTLQQNIHAIDASAVHTTGDETVSGVKTFAQTIEGTAAAAEKLATDRTITLSGAASGSVSFDGSADATLEVSIGENQGAVIGEIRWFAMSTPPEGWLVCNGAAVGTSDYAALFAAIGKTFTPQYLVGIDPPVEDPIYSDPNHFRLPDLAEKVPWYEPVKHGVGTVIDAGLPNITGTATNTNSDGINNAYPDLGCFFWDRYDYEYRPNIYQYNNGVKRDIRFDASRSSVIYGKSSTVQPPALCLLPCIRYE